MMSNLGNLAEGRSEVRHLFMALLCIAKEGKGFRLLASSLNLIQQLSFTTRTSQMVKGTKQFKIYNAHKLQYKCVEHIQT